MRRKKLTYAHAMCDISKQNSFNNKKYNLCCLIICICTTVKK